ncbi:MAG TPA: EAL domain-containing protein [Xanthobacteraceae bacterium]|nr:EAL domain-containing protein [Xanthobacteraceae bacterium]
MTFRRTALLIALVLVVLIGGSLAIVKYTTDYLLHQHAMGIAQRWARLLTDNVSDLEQIAEGQQPSSKSMAFFDWSVHEGSLHRYEIFNREGYSQLVADHRQTALVDVSEFQPRAAAAARTATTSAAVKEGDGHHLPAFYAEAYVPVLMKGQPIAVVAAFVDQTDERNQVYHAFLVAAGGLCALTLLAFMIPAGAWYRGMRAKERADAEIRFLARHDALTRLPNRLHLVERVAEALDRAIRTGREIAILHLDLDHFKDVNDRLGHQAGDAVIRLMADRIRESTCASDVVARLGGDEFAIVRTDLGGQADAETLARRLAEIMARPFLVSGHEVPATASIGIALAPADGRDPERLIRSADLALHRCKSAGRNCVRFFTPDLDAELQTRLRLEARIREATHKQAFELHFQPLVDVGTGRTVGYEALLRLRGADGAPVPPMTFIPVAEQIGLIGRIGAWVIRQACRTAVHWPDRLTVAVNLSPAQFDGTIVGVVRTALADTGLDPGRLQLEITESLLMDDTESVMAQLADLESLGVAIVMDDFGTGYSSMSYLWRFPFDKIKIDRSFIQNLQDGDTSVETIVRTIIHLGHSLKMRVTVEGVEDSRQLDLVRRLACDEAQGYYFGRPMPASDIASHLLGEYLRKPAKAAIEPRRMLQLVK